MTDIDQRRLDEAMAINAIGEVRQPLTAESLVSLLAAQFGVWMGGDDVAAFYEHVGERITKMQEEASAAKFRDALRASAPSDSIRDDRARLLDALDAKNVDEAINALRERGEALRSANHALKTWDADVERLNREIDYWKGQYRIQRESAAELDDVREDFAALVDVYSLEVRKC